MQLLPKYIKDSLPAFYSQENNTNPMVICKFFLPFTKWTWYVIEFDGNDSFFGYVVGEYNELGYFSLSELQALEGPYGIGVERDLYFEKTPLSKIKSMHE